uniref:Uncharacterized protein n=1 Tax=Acrobeloides nanus TaxID=290746 RepID=A0A914CXB3_9BILA
MYPTDASLQMANDDLGLTLGSDGENLGIGYVFIIVRDFMKKSICYTDPENHPTQSRVPDPESAKIQLQREFGFWIRILNPNSRWGSGATDIIFRLRTRS